MIQTIFEDDWVCVIDKPWGVVANNAESVKGETIQSWFAPKLKIDNPQSEFAQKGGLVHRLDKDTSGVMILAKTEDAYEKLKSQFLQRETVKKYLALVHGNLKEKSGLLSLPIDRHPKDRHKFAISDNLSRTAITEWQVVTSYKDFDLVELTPHTGRTHQLRVHLQHLGHPIVSDPIYGFRKKLSDDLKICPRLFLHAKLLTVLHPKTQEVQTFEAKIPDTLQRVLDSLVH